MRELRLFDRDRLPRIWTRMTALGCGAVSAYAVLVPTYTSLERSYPEWLPLMAWSAGPFLSAFVLAMRHPDRAWELAASIEVGVLAGLILDLQVRSHLDMPSTVWPFAILLVMVVSLPCALAGSLLGRERAKMKQRI